MDAEKLVYNLYPYWKCCDNVLYVFDNTTGMCGVVTKQYFF